MYDLVYWPDSALKEPTEKIDNFGEVLLGLTEEMVDVMVDNNGIGLAAPQVGVKKSVFVASQYGRIRTFVNPEIVHKEGEVKINEGCLSFPGVFIELPRAKKITMKFQTVEGKEQEEEFVDLMAVVCQHECDHLNGVTFLNYVNRIKRNMITRQMKATKK